MSEYIYLLNEDDIGMLTPEGCHRLILEWTVDVQSSGDELIPYLIGILGSRRGKCRWGGDGPQEDRPYPLSRQASTWKHRGQRTEIHQVATRTNKLDTHAHRKSWTRVKRRQRNASLSFHPFSRDHTIFEYTFYNHESPPSCSFTCRCQFRRCSGHSCSATKGTKVDSCCWWHRIQRYGP